MQKEDRPAARRIRATGVPILCFFVTFSMFRFVLFLGYVPSTSMEPTIPAGSWIVADRTAYWFSQPQKGEVVVFRHAGSCMVKRVAAIAGDMVSHNGPPLTVPEGYVYVVGDNLAASIDSRCWAVPYVSERQIVAKYTPHY